MDKKRTDKILDIIDVGLQEAGDTAYTADGWADTGANAGLCVRCDSRPATDNGWCDACQPTRTTEAEMERAERWPAPGQYQMRRCNCPLCRDGGGWASILRGGPIPDAYPITWSQVRNPDGSVTLTRENFSAWLSPEIASDPRVVNPATRQLMELAERQMRTVAPRTAEEAQMLRYMGIDFTPVNAEQLAELSRLTQTDNRTAAERMATRDAEELRNQILAEGQPATTEAVTGIDAAARARLDALPDFTLTLDMTPLLPPGVTVRPAGQPANIEILGDSVWSAARFGVAPDRIEPQPFDPSTLPPWASYYFTMPDMPARPPRDPERDAAWRRWIFGAEGAERPDA